MSTFFYHHQPIPTSSIFFYLFFFLLIRTKATKLTKKTKTFGNDRKNNTNKSHKKNEIGLPIPENSSPRPSPLPASCLPLWLANCFLFQCSCPQIISYYPSFSRPSPPSISANSPSLAQFCFDKGVFFPQLKKSPTP